jgi:hypothetical protein
MNRPAPFPIRWLQWLPESGWLATLSFRELRTLLALARWANNATGISWPSAAGLAKDTGLSTRHVSETLAALERKGLLRTVAAGGGRGHSARRQLLLETLPETETVSPSETLPKVGRVSKIETLPTVALNPAHRGPKPCPQRGEELLRTTENYSLVAAARPATGNNGTDHKALIQCFCEGYRRVYGRPYPFSAAPGKNGAHAKAILRGAGSLEAAERAVAAFLADRGNWLTQRRHGLGILASQLERYLSGPPVAPATAPRFFREDR